MHYLHESLQRVAERVRRVLHQRVERVSEAALADELEGGTAHPVEDVHIRRGRCPNFGGDGIVKLHREHRMSDEHITGMRQKHYPVDSPVENRGHATDVVDREHRVHHLALLAVVLACVNRQRVSLCITVGGSMGLPTVEKMP